MTNYRIHASKIKQGSTLEFEGWIDMAIEAKGYKSVAYYAQRTQVDGALHSEDTVRQYCSFIIKGIELFGSREKLTKAYDATWEYRSIVRLRSFITSATKERGLSKNTSTSTAKKAPKKVETKNVRKAMRDAGVPASKIELVMFALTSK
jgi:hypothetical protein